jgi:transcription factor IIIB subunit 2
MADGNTCTHPTSAQNFDRVRGQVTCSICGDVLADQQFELDPTFGQGGAPSGLRTAGYARPTRTPAQLASHRVNRPSTEAARRQLIAIAAKLDIPPRDVDLSVGLFKMAVNANAVVGARSAVLSACLYVVCRRQGTPHMVLDFSDVTKDSPYDIVSYMKIVCKATHTAVPPVDPSFYIARFAMQLDLGENAADIKLYAVKVLRAMQDDWIHTGRRPLGVCAAALVVACMVHGVPQPLEAIVPMIRLSTSTVLTRISEFSRTPAAQMESIDEYVASDAMDPVCFLNGRAKDQEYQMEMRVQDLAQLFYELVNEAKARAPPTAARCEKWSKFIQAKTEASGVGVDASWLDLAQLSHAQQLEALGVKVSDAAFDKPEQKTEDESQPALAASVQQARDLAAGALGQFTLSEADQQQQQQTRTQAAPADAGRSAQTALDNATSGHTELLDLSDGEEIEEEYVIYDNEARLRREKANREAFKDKWDAAALKEDAAAAAAAANGNPPPRQRKRRRQLQNRVHEAATAHEALERALHGRGVGQINLENFDQLLPGATQTADELLAMADDEAMDPEWLIE